MPKWRSKLEENPDEWNEKTGCRVVGENVGVLQNTLRISLDNECGWRRAFSLFTLEDIKTLGITKIGREFICLPLYRRQNDSSDCTCMLSGWFRKKKLFW